MRKLWLKGFSMLELLVTITIITVIAVIAIVFVGDYIQRAKLAAAKQTVAVLNEAVNEYRTMGGIAKAHSLEGAHSATQNAATLTNSAISAMRTGFTNFGQKLSFVKAGQKLDLTNVASTGQGKSFHFVVDGAGTQDTGGTPVEEVTPTLTVTAGSVAYGSAPTVDTTVSGIESQALDGQSVTLSVSGKATSKQLAMNRATFTLDSSLQTGDYPVSASLETTTIGTKRYLASSGSATLAVVKASQSAVTLTTDTTSVATNASVTLTASGGDGTGAYIWSASEGSLSATTGTSVTFTVGTNSSYSVTVYKAADSNHYASDPSSVVLSTFSADALAIITALKAAGATIPTSDEAAIYAFVQNGTTNGWWGKMVAIYGLYGNSAATTAINWKKPGTYNVAWSGTLTHNALGVRSSNYTGKGALTGLTYGSGGVLGYADIHLSAYIISGSAGYGSNGLVDWIGIIGDTSSSEWMNAGAQLGYGPSTSGSNAYARVNVSTSNWGSYGRVLLSAGAVRSKSFYIGQRNGNTQSLVLNGSTIKTDTLTSYNYGSLGGGCFYLMTDTASSTYFDSSADQHGFFSLGQALTSSEVSSFNSAVHALMVAFGRE